MMKRIPAFLKNKYLLSIIVLLVWLTFFDKNNFISQYEYQQELNKLEAEKGYYQSEIENNKRALTILQNDSVALEKYARETFLFKKANEDLFVIVPEHGSETTDYKE
ncbi:MAG TPA: septum formation initiator family protein [Bacteroidia bacterium]|nr:septum formation initiator family protein [Bacteroidia bacterium]